MIDKYGLDGHKLMYHPERVTKWLNGEEVAPILVEICPIGKCNHRCIFCAYNYTDFDGPALDYDMLIKTLTDMGRFGVKAIDWDTEGEPLLHPRLADFINHAKSVGIDSSVETNGVLLNKKFLDECLHNITYVKVSVDAATNETHYKLHKGGKKDLDKILENLQTAVDLKTDCVVGVQMVLFKENEDEVRQLADMVEEIGVDWLVVKPFSVHPFQDDSLVHMGDINKILNIPNIVVREETFGRVFFKRDYPICYGINFMSNIDCYGNVTVCNTLTRKDEYNYGNIYNDTFENIWKNRLKLFDMKECKREVCRMDKQNLYLWRLKHNKIEHINFI